MSRKWVEREYSKGDIDRAGAIISSWWRDNTNISDYTVSDTYRIVQNWRASHALPLNAFQMTLRKRAQKEDPKAIIAQRMKRFSSIAGKLAREPGMKLSQMQDLGGCRAILQEIGGVRRLCDLYDSESGGNFKCYNYIEKPKEDGYRGIHVVARYAARDEKQASWNGQRIEIQLRTRLQHAFATTVETVSTFTGDSIKSGEGTNDWKWFFSLMGSAIALIELTPVITNTPNSKEELVKELNVVSERLNVISQLNSWMRALTILRIDNKSKKAKWLLLILDVANRTIKVDGYKDEETASVEYSRLEPFLRTNKNMDVVLVSVDSIKELKTAYPNYYLDTTIFVLVLKAVLEGNLPI